MPRRVPVKAKTIQYHEQVKGAMFSGSSGWRVYDALGNRISATMGDYATTKALYPDAEIMADDAMSIGQRAYEQGE